MSIAMALSSNISAASRALDVAAPLCHDGSLAWTCLEVLPKTVVSRYVIFACATWWLSLGYSQESHRDVPSNAHFSAGEQGWACNYGFTQIAGLCMEESEALPSQGAFEFFDGQWRCRPGYHRAGKFCVPGVAPEHAAFVGGGDHWECDWGFQKTGSQCQEVKPPPHGYIDASGHEWLCYPGFARVADHCAALSNAAPTRKGTAASNPQL